MHPGPANLQFPMLGKNVKEAGAADNLIGVLVKNGEWILLTITSFEHCFTQVVLQRRRLSAVNHLMFPDAAVVGSNYQLVEMRGLQGFKSDMLSDKGNRVFYPVHCHRKIAFVLHLRLMTAATPILECVPNFSEGQDLQKIDSIASAIRAVPGAHLLHVDISPAANRTVMTFAGVPDAVLDAAFQAIRKAAEVIDMRTQVGVHPRIGATDVCPLVPLNGCTMNETVQWARQLGSRVGKELQIPIYLYEHAAEKPYRRSLPDIRAGQYERFAAKMLREEWAPDFGPAQLNEKTGATVLGARDVLVAFNISLDTPDVSKANWIAERLRESGYVKAEAGQKQRVPGLLPKLRAIGWYMADYGTAQVSMNLLDYRITSPLQVWEQAKKLADTIGVSLTGSEVIGLIPETCLLEVGSFACLKKGLSPAVDTSVLVHEAIDYLGLDRLKPFYPQEKILEYVLQKAGLLELSGA